MSFEGIPAAPVSLRSPAGLLLTLIAVCAVVALGLGALRPAQPPEWIDGVRDNALLLRGWRVAAAALCMGVGVWAVLALVASVRARFVPWVALGLLAACPVVANYAAETYWARRGLSAVWPVSGPHRSPVGTWRGVLLGSCGYGSLVHLTIGPDGEGLGRAVHVNLTSGLTSAAVVLSPLDGPHSVPVRARLLDGRMLIVAEEDTLGTPHVVRP